MAGTHDEPSVVTVLMERLEGSPLLENIGAAVGPIADTLAAGTLGDALRGKALGHALHPFLVQVPLGALLSAIVLDTVQGRRAAGQSRLLVGLALLGAVPSVASGLAEWARADSRTQRVGIAHAGLNAAGTVAALASFLARGRGWSPTAAVLAGVAGSAYGAGGLLGGHLSLVRKYASHDEPSDTEGMVRGRLAG